MSQLVSNASYTALRRSSVSAALCSAPLQVEMHHTCGYLPQWPLQQRRRYLLEHNGFWCACAKCLAEEKAAALAPSS